ncbi:hypothetical protein AVEN_176246-1, partial [Araneus ventricosus]
VRVWAAAENRKQKAEKYGGTSKAENKNLGPKSTSTKKQKATPLPKKVKKPKMEHLSVKKKADGKQSRPGSKPKKATSGKKALEKSAGAKAEVGKPNRAAKSKKASDKTPTAKPATHAQNKKTGTKSGSGKTRDRS